MFNTCLIVNKALLVSENSTFVMFILLFVYKSAYRLWLVVGVLCPGNIYSHIRMGTDLRKCALMVTL